MHYHLQYLSDTFVQSEQSRVKGFAQGPQQW